MIDPQVIGATETVILPSLTGIICSTGLVGNILIVFTIVRSKRKHITDIYICNLANADLVNIIGMPFLTHQWARGGEWVFGSPLCAIITSLDTCNQFTCSAIMTAMSLDRYLALVQPFRLTNLRTRSKTIQVNLRLCVMSLILMFPVWVYSKVIKFKDGLESCAFDLTSPDDVLWYTLCLTITTFFFPLPLIFICYILILCYTWETYQQKSKQEGDKLGMGFREEASYTTSIPRQRILSLTKMVLALVSAFVVSAAPFHVIQLMNLQVSQPTLTFYVSYYISICLSYASSRINPFLYILLSGNSQKRLWRCTKVEVRMTDQDVNGIVNTVKFLIEGFSPRKSALYMYRFFQVQ
ncbi:melanin-concentrating hormone receptor 2 [Pezoporus occidentalis]|uniref:melanin-concentrating hormone receptor 2 n=1 Tax=Pezoporus occidentalis TaxID=407982 RepID=UPI002F90BDC6